MEQDANQQATVDQTTDQQSDSGASEASNNQESLNWDKVQQEFGLTPEKAIELAKRQHNFNKFFDNKSKELSAAKREAEQLKQQYEQMMNLLQNPDYVKQYLSQQQPNMGGEENPDERLQKLLDSKLNPLAQQQKQLQELIHQQRVVSAQAELENVLSIIDKDIPEAKLASQDSRIRKMVITDIMQDYTGPNAKINLDHLTTKDKIELFKTYTLAALEDLKNQGFLKPDKNYVASKKEKQKQFVTETGNPNMGGTAVNNKDESKNQFFERIGQKFKKMAFDN